MKNSQILVHSNNAPFVDVLSSPLSQIGYSVLTSTTWGDAVRVFCEQRPGLIVFDLDSGDLTNLCEFASENTGLSETPILAMGYSQMGAQAQHAGPHSAIH